MSDGTEFDVDEHARAHDPESRVRALQSLLVEKELLSTDAVDEIIATYEHEIGPLNGARVVARAWTDDEYRDRLLADGMAAAAEVVDVDGDAIDLEVVANGPDEHHLVVCTLCSCYPWALLGLPPTWYKTPEYRSRAVKEPRALLADEFGTDLPPDVEVHVHDSTSECRYMVLPQRPSGTAGMAADELVDLVTRDAMIGVERLEDTCQREDTGEGDR
ncbi:nitrile hydratase subunit alpha [Natronococcus sp.]|uniref:nitrile hydratase subunit alpha n=1 Tax=Natronococcus sp. TaxID=35747 RepID=UPI003A4E5DE6